MTYPHFITGFKLIYAIFAHPTLDFPLHTHQFAEVQVVEQGKMRHVVNGKTQVLRPGDLVMIRPQEEGGTDRL